MCKTDFDNKLIHFNRKTTSNRTKYLEIPEKLNSLIAKDHNFFLGRIYLTTYDGCQNTFIYQPTLATVKLKRAKVLISLKLKGVYYSKFKPLYAPFLHSIKRSGYRIGIKFDKDPLPVKQNNYLSKVVNVYIVYDLDASPRNPTNHFKIKNFLFGATSIVKNNDEENYV